MTDGSSTVVNYRATELSFTASSMHRHGMQSTDNAYIDSLLDGAGMPRLFGFIDGTAWPFVPHRGSSVHGGKALGRYWY